MTGEGPRPSRQKTAAGWLSLGVPGALLLYGLVFIHVPAWLWAGNVSEFHFPFTSFLLPGAIAVGAGLLVSWLVAVVLPVQARLILAAIVSAAGFVAWLYAAFGIGRLTSFNGVVGEGAVQTPLGVWELAVVLIAIAVIAAVFVRFTREAVFLLTLLNVGLVAITAASLLGAQRRHVTPPDGPDGTVFRFSRSRNVLVLVLDGLQSTFARRVLRSDSELARTLDGFRFYEDAAGVAPTTFLSLPAIHSGTVYRPPASIPDYFERSIKERSFLTRFADAGYEAVLVNPEEGICPDRVAACVSAERLVRPAAVQLRMERLRLLDLSLFRVSPFWVKQRLFDRGTWLSAGAAATPNGASLEEMWVYDGIGMFEQLARGLFVNDGKPTLKFVHSLATHTPYFLNERCQADGVQSVDRLATQARCALHAVALLLDRMKRAGVYDQSVIALIADHGIYQGVYPPDRPGSHSEWVHLAGAANPLVMLKLPGAHGPLEYRPDPVYLADIGATLCAVTGACTAPGIPLGEAPPGRTRRFNQYVWNHAFWKVRTIPNLTPYDVTGPVWDRRSWRLAATAGAAHEEPSDARGATASSAPSAGAP